MINNQKTYTPSNLLLENLINNIYGIFYRSLSLYNFDLSFVSEGSLKLTGYNSEELLNKSKITLDSLIHKDDLEKFKNRFNQTNTFNGEYRLICRKGNVKWVRELSNVIYNENNEFLFVEGYIQDITLEKNNDLVFKAFESYQNTINKTSIVSITDKNGEIIFANELFCYYSKYSKQELIGKNHRIINSGNHTKEFFSKMWKTILSGSIWRGEIKNKAKDGSFYWVDTSISPILNDKNEIESFLSIRNIITEKKSQEEKLIETLKAIEEEKDFNQNVFSSLTSNIAVIDNEGNIIKTNKAWDDFYIQNNGDLNNKKYNYLKVCEKSLKSGNLEAKIAYKGIKSILQKKSNLFEFVYPCHSENEKRWFLLRATPYNGLFSGAVLSHYNITKQKESELQVEEANKKIQSIYNSSVFVIMIAINEKGIITAINSGTEKILGYKDKDLVNISILDLFLEQEINIHSQKISKKLNRKLEQFEVFKQNFGYKKIRSIELTCIKKDGSTITVLLSVSNIKDNLGKITGYLITAIDISERKKWEHKLRENQEMLIEAQNISKVGSWEYFYDSGIVKFSDQIYKIHDLDPKIEYYKDTNLLYKFIHPDDLIIVKKSINRAIKRKKDFFITYRIITPIGNKKWIERKDSYIKDKKGNLIVKGTLQDITELKKKELSHIKLVEELNKKNNELMQFNYIVSHNLRAPVAKIMGLVELLNISYTQEEKDEIIEYISTSAIQLDEVIKDLNVILSSKSLLNEIKEKFSFKDILLRIFNSLEKQVIESNAVISVNIDDKNDQITSIKSYIESIFYNLISNSIKHRSTLRQLEINIYITKTRNNITTQMAK